jgi:hypothetical protein
MHVRIQSLQGSEAFAVALRKDGWAVEPGQGDTLRARHPEAPDESAARSRLHRLGMLTAGWLRIEFCHAGPREAAEQGF